MSACYLIRAQRYFYSHQERLPAPSPQPLHHITALVELGLSPEKTLKIGHILLFLSPDPTRRRCYMRVDVILRGAEALSTHQTRDGQKSAGSVVRGLLLCDGEDGAHEMWYEHCWSMFHGR
jgi:hypothetical protein